MTTTAAATSSVSAPVSFFCGAMAGVISKTAVAPVERTKILSQIDFVKT
jgi:hypothetical protein